MTIDTTISAVADLIPVAMTVGIAKSAMNMNRPRKQVRKNQHKGFGFHVGKK